MKDLNYLSMKINEIDEEMIKLFRARMEIVSQVGAYKIEHHMEVLDENREKEIFEKHTANIENINERQLIEEFLRNIITLSKKNQQKLMQSKGVK